MTVRVVDTDPRHNADWSVKNLYPLGGTNPKLIDAYLMSHDANDFGIVTGRVTLSHDFGIVTRQSGLQTMIRFLLRHRLRIVIYTTLTMRVFIRMSA